MSTDDWLSLGLASGMRGADAATLLERFGEPQAVLSAAADDLRSSGLARRTVDDLLSPDERTLKRCREWLADESHRIVTWVDDAFPPLLRAIDDAPALLFVRGCVDALSIPQLAIVGSRNATPSGCETARRFATHLSRAGFCITSGLAIGIDAAAHAGALDANARTIAVCATGPDEVYPGRHARLADSIAAHGAIVTEFPPGSPPRRAQFPRRNRLISGMSVGTLVVEAGLRSGALITARFASEQGREVFAIPGSIHNPTARGCHRLIRDGAKLVETADDIIEELPSLLGGAAESVRQNTGDAAAEQPFECDPDYQRLLELMGWDPFTADILVGRSGLTPEEVSSMLLMLELEGRVEPLRGGLYQQREEGPTK